MSQQSFKVGINICISETFATFSTLPFSLPVFSLLCSLLSHALFLSPLLSLPACLSSRSNCFQICVGGQGPGVLLHAKFINRAVFPDGHWLQPG